MAASTTTSGVYIHVIEDVISKVREEFVGNGGPGEGVLHELQGIWEMKMIQAGVMLSSIDRSSSAQKRTPGGAITPVHDLNVPYEGTEEYETPTAEMLFPPTPLQTPAPTPVPGSADNSMYNYPTPAPDTGGSNVDMKGARQSPYTQSPSPWSNQRSLSVDVNVAPVEGRDEMDRRTSNQPPTQDFLMMSSGKRKREDFSKHSANGGYIPQQDGARDDTPKAIQGGYSLFTGGNPASLTRSSMKIPQVDGPTPDPYDEMLSTPNMYNYQGEEYNMANTPALTDVQANTPVAAQNDTGDEVDEELLNEDDDDDDLDDVDDDEDMNTQHLVLAQFDKVTRTKSKWKCTLKNGIMHINEKDVLFNKATGEFDF